MKAAWLFAFVFSFLFPSIASALDGTRRPTQHMHDAWNENEGLPQNSVKAIAQTPNDGFLWLGTEEGLVRFDGATFRTFDKTNATGRTTNVVNALAVDNFGRLVILGGKDGVCTFDEPKFSCTALEGDANAVITAGPNVFVATSRGLYTREGNGYTRNAVLGDANVRSVGYGPGDRIVAVVKDRGVVIVQHGAAKTLELSLRPDEITGVFRLKDNTTWLATTKGPYILDQEKLVVPSFGDRPEKPIRFIGDDSDGNVWISVFDDGLFRTRGTSWVKVPLGTTQPAERLDAFFEDDEKNVWIGSRLSGLHRLRDGAFVPWGIAEGITHGFVSAVLAGHDDDVLIATGNGGLFVLRDDRLLHLGKKDGLPTDQIVSLAKGKNGTYLVGTRAGLARVITVEPPKVVADPAFKDEHVTAILERANDELYVATLTGLGQISITRNGATEILPNGFMDYIVTFLEARDGTIWMGQGSGLARLKDGKREVPFLHELRETSVSSLAEREDGTILVGTSDAGLWVIKDNAIKHVFRRQQGLYDDTVHAIVEGDGKLWMLCNKGVYTMNVADLGARSIVSTSYGRESGMRSREGNGGSPAGTQDAHGRIWFATMLGAAMVDPKKLSEPPPPRMPIIDSARVAGRAIPHPTFVSLPIDARALEVTLASPSLADPERTTFELRIGEGPWTPISGRVASFPSFTPGAHKIEVRAKNAEGKTSDIAGLYVDVPPRFTETSLFRAGAAILAGGVVVALGLMRLRASERARRRLEAIVAERTRELASRNEELERALENLKKAETDLVRAERMASVATLVRGIAHELNNPLGFVTGNIVPLRRYAEFLLTAVKEVGEGKKQLADVRLNERRDLAFVQRDLDKLLTDMEEGGRRAKLIVGDLQNLTAGPDGGRALAPVDLARVVEQSVRLLGPAKPDGVTIRVNAEPAPPITARAGEIEQAVVNLVDNALRAIGKNEGTITIGVRADGDARIVSVEDDGPGMPEEVRVRATEPFFTTRAAGEGSGLGLAIVQRIAEHHGGALTIESTPGEGTRVELRVRNVT